MFVTFRCDAYEDVTLLGEVAIQLLHMMGHTGTIPSALMAKDVPSALAKLQQGISQHTSADLSNAKAYDEEEDEGVSLSLRAWPLIQLLKHASLRGCDVLWDSK